MTGWWFGTCFIFPFIANHNPKSRIHTFQRGRLNYQADEKSHEVDDPNYKWIITKWLTNHYPLVNIQIAIENGPVEIVELPIQNSDFP